MVRCYYDRYGYRRCTNSAWNNWVRWVVLVIIVVGFLFLFVLCSCITARRRRKAGRRPFYGTGWAARPLYNNNAQNPNQYNAQPYYANQPAPPYDAAVNNHNGYNQGYYGQQSGVELQPPQPTYGGYAPPPGPPPAKA